MASINFKCVSFAQLTLNELYQLLALRQEVFIVEQTCLFQDIDGKDQNALHCIGQDEAGNVVACTRLFNENAYYEGYLSIGRVANSSKYRGTGLGKKLMTESIKQTYLAFGKKPIKIGAQKYLEAFYESFGFKSTGEDYMEDGILHTYMIL